METETMDRLKKCFLTVFPELHPSEIEHASERSVEKWDSLRAITLVALIEEEFGIEFEAEDILSFTSFHSVQACALRKISQLPV